jgi:hypothetical protein
MKNIPIAICFAVITTSQFALGIWMTVLAAKIGGEDQPFDQGKHDSHSERVPCLVAITSLQLKRSRQYPSTHSTYAYSYGIEI